MSSRVLRNAVLVDDRELLGVDAPRRVTAVSGDTFSEAYDRGKRDGYEEGRQAADDAIAEVGRRIEAAFSNAVVQLRQLQQERTALLISEAAAIAEFVVGRDVRASVEVLIPRIEAALATIDDAPLTVYVSPDDAEAVEQALDGNPTLTVAADPGLHPGEARVAGAWVEADLTVCAAVDAVKEALT